VFRESEREDRTEPKFGVGDSPCSVINRPPVPYGSRRNRVSGKSNAPRARYISTGFTFRGGLGEYHTRTRGGARVIE